MGQHVALVGKMGSGKTTIATELAARHGYVRLALADEVKDDACAALSAVVRSYERRSSAHPNRLKAAYYPRITREIVEANKGVFRPLLQWLGTEFWREFQQDPTHWIDLYLHRVSQVEKPVVCDDCRFANEAEALRRAGFLIVRVWRPEDHRLAALGPQANGVAAHASETEMEKIVPDLHVTNDWPSAPATIAASLVAWEEARR